MIEKVLKKASNTQCGAKTGENISFLALVGGTHIAEKGIAFKS